MVIAALLIGITGGFAAEGVVYSIKFINTLLYYGNFSAEYLEPSESRYGLLVILIPAAGGLVAGLMTFLVTKGSEGEEDSGDAERVLSKDNKSSAGISYFRPVTSIIAIGTGAPFGAEGPVMAAGSAIGSLFTRILRIGKGEGIILLAAGASAGLAGIFGSPFAAIFFSVELLLSEYSPRTLIPVTLASLAAAGVRITLHGTDPMFSIPGLAPPSNISLSMYLLIGGLVGTASVLLTWSVYLTGRIFRKLSVHWRWWPAIGGLCVGMIGYYSPDTLGVGYSVIRDILSGEMLGTALILLFVLKAVSWSVSFGSTVTGGTIAPMFIVGGGLGVTVSGLISMHFPDAGLDPRMAGLVGMAAMFGGVSRAMLTSTVFAFETTLQAHALLPLLLGCTASYLISSLLTGRSIMTEKLVRKGLIVPKDPDTDILEQVLVREVASYGVATLNGTHTVEEVNDWINSGDENGGFQGFPIIDEKGNLTGVITRRDIYDENVPHYTKVDELIKRPPVVVFEDNTLRDAVNIMSKESVGRLPVVTRNDPRKVRAILTRSDILKAHSVYTEKNMTPEKKKSFFRFMFRRK